MQGERSASLAEPLLRACDLNVSFGGVPILRDVSVEVHAAETLTILGDSGCGKTTLLKVMAGMLVPSTGEVWLEGQELMRLPIRERGVVYLDQEPHLFEHLNVRDNVAFPLRCRGSSRSQREASVTELLPALGLESHADKRVWQLSGGQKQRVAFARAIMARPKLLLLDEPFSSLDGKTRADMQTLMRALLDHFRITAVFVTHDLREAISVGSRFGLMVAGGMRMFADREAFIRDEATGVPGEIRFWQRAAADRQPSDA